MPICATLRTTKITSDLLDMQPSSTLQSIKKKNETYSARLMFILFMYTQSILHITQGLCLGIFFLQNGTQEVSSSPGRVGCHTTESL